ncbi:hypothetical protein Goarm_002474, partial [Gossypium armourianum]|nr:hypothetical protein [Gossypium armourianum]
SSSFQFELGNSLKHRNRSHQTFNCTLQIQQSPFKTQSLSTISRKFYGFTERVYGSFSVAEVFADKILSWFKAFSFKCYKEVHFVCFLR